MGYFCYDVYRKYSIVHSNDLGPYEFYGNNYYCWTYNTKTRYAYCGEASNDFVGDCPNNMYVQTATGHSKDSSVAITNAECRVGNGFTFVDNECLENNEGYTHQLCLSGASAELFDEEEAEFTVYSELCTNGKPVYHYETFSTGEATGEVFANGESAVEETVNVDKRYYLHYSMEGNWIISLNVISETHKAICYEDDLLDCTASAWSVLNETIVEYTEYINENYTSSAIEIMSEFVVDAQMAIAMNECGYVLEEKEDGSGVGTTELVAIIAVVIFLVLAVAFGFFLFRKNKMKKGVVSWKQDEIEIEQDVPITTNQQTSP